MDAERFESRLLAWIDGELPPAEAAEMEAHAAAHPEARERARAERAFEARVASALTPHGERERVAALLAAARPAPLRRGRPYLAGLASAAAVVVAAMWFYCVPPFECPYVEALDVAVGAAPRPAARPAPELPALPAGTGPPSAARPVAVEGVGAAWRWDLRDDEGLPLAILACETGDERPSFRRRVERQGRRWWIAYERGRTFVAFVDPAAGLLWCAAGPQREDELLDVAESLRTDGPPR